MQHYRLLPVVLTAILFAAVPAAGEGIFLSEFEDLPLAPGLSEAPGGMLFDSPSGRIVDAMARGAADGSQIRSFYLQTLPGLGWENVDESSFRRDNELLRIDIDAANSVTTVHFSVVPQ